MDERRGIDIGGAFNNHNVEKLGITLNLKTERGQGAARGAHQNLRRRERELRLRRPGSHGLPLRAHEAAQGRHHLREQLRLRTPRPLRALQDLGTHRTGRFWTHLQLGAARIEEPAGWGYSYMDHTGAYYMAMAILLALVHRNRTGEGQWVDLACTDAGASAATDPALLDYTVNGRSLRRQGMPHSQSQPVALHGTARHLRVRGGGRLGRRSAAATIATGRRSSGVIGAELGEARRASRSHADRLTVQDELDAAHHRAWTSVRNKFDVEMPAARGGNPGGRRAEAGRAHRPRPHHARLRAVAGGFAHGNRQRCGSTASRCTSRRRTGT